MDVLFMDLDGVLLLANEQGHEVVSKQAVQLINELTRRTELELAIISDRRNNTAPDELFSMLRSIGLGNPKITLCQPGVSFVEAVQDRLRASNPAHFAVLDDTPARYEGAKVYHPHAFETVELCEKLVVPSNRYGLLPEGMHKLCELFGVPSFVTVTTLQEASDDEL